MVDLTGRIIGAESSGNPFARNPRSSAGGLGQFIDSTWLATVKKHRPDLAASKSDGELLRLKFDPALSRQMTAAYAADNQGFLRGRGIEPTPGNTYLAHFAGPQGAAAIHADPGAPVERLLGARAVAANPFLRGKTGADVINWAAGKVGDKGGRMAYGTTAGPVAAPVAGTTGTLGTLPDFGPLPSERQRKLAQMLYSQAIDTANRATNPLGAFAAMAQAAAGRYVGEQHDEATAARNRKMAEALMGAKTDDELQRTLLASGDEDLIKAAINQRVTAAKPVTPELTEIYDEQGRRQKVLFNPRTGEYKTVGGPAIGREEADELSLNPIQRSYQGKRQIGQVSKRGGIKWTDVEGEILSGLEKVDTGTEVQLRDKRTGEVVTSQPKDVAGKEAQQEVGKQSGQAQAALPGARTALDNALMTVNKLRSHPGLDRATGISNWADPRNWAGGTVGADFLAKNKEAQGQSFMVAREALKGAGQVTDFEGAKGEQAIANLDAAQSREQYLDALATLERMMRASYEDLQKKAGMAGRPTPAGGAPQTPADAAAARRQKYGLE
jgi:hypothetical protein